MEYWQRNVHFLGLKHLVFTLLVVLYITHGHSLRRPRKTAFSRFGKKSINVVLLVPRNNRFMFSYDHVIPALDIAIEKLEANPALLHGHYINLRYNDTMCQEPMGMNHAINYYYLKQVDVFFGPVCDYVIAPVLRQLTFWNLPMITVGGNARGFVRDRKTMFPMLTRMGPVSHYNIVNFFLQQAQMHNWRSVKVVYDKHGQDFIVTDFCHLSIEVLYHELRNFPHILNHVGLKKFDAKDNMERLLLDEVALDHGGESSPVTNSMGQNFVTHYGYSIRVSSV